MSSIDIDRITTVYTSVIEFVTDNDYSCVSRRPRCCGTEADLHLCSQPEW